MARLLVFLCLFAAAVLAASPPPDRGDAGAPGDAGRDAGRVAASDAGHSAAPAAGAPGDEADAGRAAIASWQRGDGGLLDGGVTDAIALSVGASLDLTFPLQVLLMLCDDPLVVHADILSDRIVLTGVAPGATHCGFWFNRGSIPARYIGVAVLDDEAPGAKAAVEPQRASEREDQMMEPLPVKEPPPAGEWQFEPPAWAH